METPQRRQITASNFHEVCHKNIDDEGNQNTSSLLNKLMLYTTKPNIPAITYGQKIKKELGLNIKPYVYKNMKIS